jgi:hypothetical protein
MQDTTTATVDLDGPTTLVETAKLLREVARLVEAEVRRHLDETDHDDEELERALDLVKNALQDTGRVLVTLVNAQGELTR